VSVRSDAAQEKPDTTGALYLLFVFLAFQFQIFGIAVEDMDAFARYVDIVE
jgi:hypothetical protein